MHAPNNYFYSLKKDLSYHQRPPAGRITLLVFANSLHFVFLSSFFFVLFGRKRKGGHLLKERGVTLGFFPFFEFFSNFSKISHTEHNESS